VFARPDGDVSAVVALGANYDWDGESESESDIFEDEAISALLLQCEIPQSQLLRFSRLARDRGGIEIFLDCGGITGPDDVSDELLKLVDYISPNVKELEILTGRGGCDSLSACAQAAKVLIDRGARCVIVTRGQEGSLMVRSCGEMVSTPSIVGEEESTIVDTTGAGDAFKAAFVVSRLAEKKSFEEALQFANAAGFAATRKRGGGSLSRSSVEKLVDRLRGGSGSSDSNDGVGGGVGGDNDVREKSFKYASRLNSFRDSPLDPSTPESLPDYITRMSSIRGLDLIDFNYPPHLPPPTPSNISSIRRMLSTLGPNLKCGAVCLRFPPEMRRGAYTNPSPEIRDRAVELTCDACSWSRALGGGEVVVWSAYCGYDYPLQADYDLMHGRVAEAFRRVCDANGDVKVSIEFKPTDENTRFFAVPTTHAAILLLGDVGRENFGITLDFGHLLMAGENPAQSVSFVNRHAPGKLFGVQMGDGYLRCGGEDGLMVGSVNYLQTLEFVYQLLKTPGGFRGHVYFDTFPRNEDPVKEAERNIRVVEEMARVAGKLLRSKEYEGMRRDHDAVGILDLIDSLKKNNDTHL